jgi:hypothetical protein
VRRLEYWKLIGQGSKRLIAISHHSVMLITAT